MRIEQIPIRADNYVTLLHDEASGATAAMDPAEPETVLRALEALGWRLSLIFNTHHHHDHVGGNLALKQATGARVVGAAADADRLPGLDQPVRDGDEVALGQAKARVLSVPGHTRGHVAYWFQAEKALFSGDTLFSLGCGRLFEGTPKQMWDSLCRLRALPPDTSVYCAHEYTQANGRFARVIEPGNAALAARLDEVDALRAGGLPTVPVLLGRELATNPFLRADQPEVAQAAGFAAGGDPLAVFAELRRRKDVF